ncbi:hypothetical protein L3556_13910 [Candidatus Synechococcus calcipolaris G9]|uniref:Uncharacterized protein n=1 Tax=Candidatus Synechococcus calcipolaris G9 TaxID=1497997 RepID=A0ABT6F2D2_9SYNE|nr:hypothetical protein [Candidatus Synechococcus calcipolaris]MDG2992016.1 hypothetical protein [Candidatus Synechococcus calcipolaris G9]
MKLDGGWPWGDGHGDGENGGRRPVSTTRSVHPSAGGQGVARGHGAAWGIFAAAVAMGPGR